MQQDHSRSTAAVLPFPQRLLIADLSHDHLRWLPELGLGYFPVATGIAPYDAAYFDRFARQADSDIGRKLMAARVNFVARHWTGQLCDVGIGSGAFIERRLLTNAATFGYDVNPAALDWLDQRGLLVDPHLVPFDALTLWDVLEHIHDFRSLVANARQWLFVSLPIFTDMAHVLRSKHYRRDEHCWYFTRDGLVNLMATLGFALVEDSDMEVRAGREDIGAFAFRRAVV